MLFYFMRWPSRFSTSSQFDVNINLVMICQCCVLQRVSAAAKTKKTYDIYSLQLLVSIHFHV